VIYLIMVIKKTTTTSSAIGSDGKNGSGGTKGSGASRGLDKASSVIGTSFGTTGTAEIVIHQSRSSLSVVFLSLRW
jgi:hypothetical protein